MLHKKHPELIYEKFHIVENTVTYNFLLKNTEGNDIVFKPKIIFNKNITSFANHIFHIGLIETLSYWKSACPPILRIKCGFLNTIQINFVLKLFKFGLGEFFYLNGFDPQNPPLPKIIIDCNKKYDVQNTNFEDNKKILVPIGGGKDSCLTLERLKKINYSLLPFVMNPKPEVLKNIYSMQFDKEKCIFVERKICINLLKLNGLGYYNGHTPFSALLAFISTLVARINSCSFVALSNEASANESTVKSQYVNHQYSKSLEFENDFRKYYQKFIPDSPNYFSFLRPYNELQIAKNFSKIKHAHTSFRSCNAGSKDGVWCNKCGKCLFVALILAPFLQENEIKNIFHGENILNKKNLKSIFDELVGIAENKPFDCVGSLRECQIASFLAEEKNYYLINDFCDNNTKLKPTEKEIEQFFNKKEKNNIPQQFQKLLL